MRNFIMGLVTGLFIATAAAAIASPDWLGTQEIWNRCFNSGTNTIKIIGV